MTIYFATEMGQSTFVHKGQVVMPKHLRFRLKAIQRRMDSAKTTLQDVGNIVEKQNDLDVKMEQQQPEMTQKGPISASVDANQHQTSTRTSDKVETKNDQETKDTTVTSTVKKQKRKVHFAPMAKVLLVRRLSGDEMKKVWYTSEEYRRFDRDRRRTVAIVHQAAEYNVKIDSSKYTSLGLEKYLEATSPFLYKRSPTHSLYPSKVEKSMMSRHEKVWQHTRDVLAQQEYDRMYQMPSKQQQSLPYQGLYYNYNTSNGMGYSNYGTDSMYPPHSDVLQESFYPPQQPMPRNFYPYMSYSPVPPRYGPYFGDSPIVITPAA